VETAHLINTMLYALNDPFSRSVKKYSHCSEIPMSLRNSEILPAGGDDWLLQPSCKSSNSLTRTILWAHSFISKWRKSIKHVSVEFRSSLWRPELTITPRITENTWDCSHLPIHTTQSILKHLSSLKVAFTNNRTQFLQKKNVSDMHYSVVGMIFWVVANLLHLHLICYN